jgi:hypothetical protein
MENFPERFGPVSMLRKILGQRNRFRENIAERTPQSIEPGRGRMRPQHQGKSRRRTHSLVAIGEVKAHPLIREGIEMRSLRGIISIGAESWLQIIDQQHENIGFPALFLP